MDPMKLAVPRKVNSEITCIYGHPSLMVLSQVATFASFICVAGLTVIQQEVTSLLD